MLKDVQIKQNEEDEKMGQSRGERRMRGEQMRGGKEKRPEEMRGEGRTGEERTEEERRIDELVYIFQKLNIPARDRFIVLQSGSWSFRSFMSS